MNHCLELIIRTLMADGEELVLLRVVVINNLEMIDRFLIA